MRLDRDKAQQQLSEVEQYFNAYAGDSGEADELEFDEKLILALEIAIAVPSYTLRVLTSLRVPPTEMKGLTAESLEGLKTRLQNFDIDAGIALIALGSTFSDEMEDMVDSALLTHRGEENVHEEARRHGDNQDGIDG